LKLFFGNNDSKGLILPKVIFVSLSKTKLFIIFPLLILVGFTGYANGQAAPPLSIDAQTNQNFYEYGDSVSVSGKIKNYDADLHSGFPVTYRVLDPNGEQVKSGLTNLSYFGAFNFNFIARGEPFEPSGNYRIEMSFGSVNAELQMFFTGGESEIADVTAPEILQPADIVIYSQTRDGVTFVSFEVLATDDTDEIIKITCKPSSGYLFGIGDTLVKCTAKDSAGNFATPVSFTVSIKNPETTIPSWVKNVAEFWCHEKIDDGSFVEGIQYLIEKGIIVVPATSESSRGTQEVPQWVKNNACWWSEDSITDLDFALGLEYLVRHGIIRV